ncbi:MAG: transglutaminase domain-containing protein [Actinobacteria bacterium]|nr:MAG: transglutaminase domain-containing protein [Actinomycetota bacterium]
MARTAAFWAAPSALLAWSWLRLSQPHAAASTALSLIALALAPALLPRPRQRVLALVPASVLALHVALGVWLVHPLRLLGRFGGGFLEFYDVRLPFATPLHPRMEGVILVALFAFCACLGVVVAARRPALAALVLVVGVGWPATLLTGPDDLLRGVLLLAAALSLIAGLGGPLQPRRLLLAGVALGAIVLAAFAASTSSAVASGQVLHWQGWDFYTKPAKPVGVGYVWNSNFTGLHFPKKVTPLLTIRAPSRPTYWRATTLDVFDGRNWREKKGAAVPPIRIGGRDELLADPELPAAARDPRRWFRQDVQVRALRDNHFTGAGVPVAFEPGSHPVTYAQGGVAHLEDSLAPGERYSVWSYEAQPTPQRLAALPARYPEQVRTVDLEVEPGVAAPPFGAPNRERQVAVVFRRSPRPYQAVYRTARRVVGEPANPYAAALELEGWFRSGAFQYDERPPQIAGVPPLAAFVTQTRRGYCQHFAGAMALMLRYLGIPARVAAGFTTGEYDRSKHEWTVTDHDAHTWVEAWFPRYGWLPFDPTPGRGSLGGSYTTASPHFDFSAGLLAVAQHLKRPGAFDLRKLRGSGKGKGARAVPTGKTHTKAGSSGAGIGALLRLLVLVAAGLVAAVVATKLAVRKARYLTRDPRMLARACVCELSDFAADQGAKAPPSATLGELAQLVEAELGVSASAFASAAAEARFGPTVRARAAARIARRELRSLRRELRAALTRTERARGALSLRSLGLTA